jgi:hypothetical protein
MKFKLGARVTVSAYTEVEADSPEEAITKAKRRSVSFGGTGSGAHPEEVWVIEGADGEPLDIRAEED